MKEVVPKKTQRKLTRILCWTAGISWGLILGYYVGGGF